MTARLACAAAMLLCAASARADVVDLSGGRRDPRGRDRIPTLVVRAEGGSDFAPFGIVGGCISYLNVASLFALEVGAGAGFPGVQFGFAARKLFGEQGSFFVFELAIVGNSRVERGGDVTGIQGGAPIVRNGGRYWSTVGLGFEQRVGPFSVGVTGGLVFTPASQNFNAYVHGGLGLGIF